MLNRLDSFFIRVVTAADFFSIDMDRQFPPGSQIHATNSLSSISPFGGNPQFFAIASIVSFRCTWSVEEKGHVCLCHRTGKVRSVLGIAPGSRSG